MAYYTKLFTLVNILGFCGIASYHESFPANLSYSYVVNKSVAQMTQPCKLFCKFHQNLATAKVFHYEQFALYGN